MDDRRYSPPDSPVVDVDLKPRPPRNGFWYIAFLLLFAVINAYLAFTPYGNLWSMVTAVLSVASAVQLWRRSLRSKYPLYVLTLLMGTAIPMGIYNYVRNPALLSQPLEKQIISWLIPVIPIVVLIGCCVYARRLGRV
jgi:uncharacterized membrane protein YhaH (DUF805 family)